MAETDVKDLLNREIQDSSPRVAYVRAVLMGMASPHELGQRQLSFVAFLLERWASKVEVARKPVAEEDGVPPLVVDLAGERAPERLQEGSPLPAEPRYLDTRKLSKSLRNRVALLRKGESPAKLALGEDCVQPSCEQTLVFLFRHWCQVKPAHPLAGRGATLTAQVTNDMEAIHHYMSAGGERRQVEAKELTQQQRLEMETFGRIRSVHNVQYTSARGYALEDWLIEDDSAHELHIVRPAGQGAKRYAHGQLVTVRPPDASGFILGQVRWLIGALNGELRAGVKLMPGIATATSVRATGLNKAERPTPALSLAGVPAVKSPPTLVLPAGWYKPNRVVEVVGDKPYNVRLTEVVERGSDFERIAYEAA